MKTITSIALLLLPQLFFGQKCDTTFNEVSYNYCETDSSNKIILLANKENGVLNGPSVSFKKIWLPDTLIQGQIIGDYNNGKKEGVWTTYDSNQEIIHQGKFKKGKPIGHWCMWGGFEIFIYNKKGELKAKGKGCGCGCSSNINN